MKQEKRNNKHRINILKKFIIRIKQPGQSLADFIYTVVYKGQIDKIPYPILLFIIKYYGGWAGIGIMLPIREYRYKEKVNKIVDVTKLLIGPIVIIPIIIYGITKTSENFLFGFVQELLAEIDICPNPFIWFT